MTQTLETERTIQRRVVAHFRAMGWSVYPTNQRPTGKRASRNAKGFPDLWCMKPGHGGLFFEVKAPHGQPSPAQVSFQAACRAAGVVYVLGGLVECYQFAGGLIEP